MAATDLNEPCPCGSGRQTAGSRRGRAPMSGASRP
ncbi:MAG: SEC-C domain-containing protein [Desulfovibrio sp.]|nr:SEC-C domain-containing protein [Desulfovibrio sp.]